MMHRKVFHRCVCHVLAALVLIVLPMASGAAESTSATDPAPPVTGHDQVLTLQQCIDLALEYNPTLLIASERLHIAGKDVSDAWGAFLPDLSLSRNYQKADRTDFDVQTYQPAIIDSIQIRDHFTDDLLTWYSQINVPAGVEAQTIHTKYKDWNGRATLNVFSGFSKFSSLSSAKHGRAAAEATLGYNRELVVQDVLTAYYNLLRYQKLEDVALEARDRAAKELERTQTYFRLGSAAKSDVLQQKVQLENTKLDAVVAHNNVAKAFADLAFVMNRPLAEQFSVDSSVLDTDFQVEDVSTLYDEALANRLDLHSSEEQVLARRKDITTASGNPWWKAKSLGAGGGGSYFTNNQTEAGDGARPSGTSCRCDPCEKLSSNDQSGAAVASMAGQMQGGISSDVTSEYPGGDCAADGEDKCNPTTVVPY